MSKKTYTAELIEGRSYTLMIPNNAEPKSPDTIVFERGEGVPVSDAIKEYLDETAWDASPAFRGGIQVGVQRIPKFQFTPILEDAA